MPRYWEKSRYGTRYSNNSILEFYDWYMDLFKKAKEKENVFERVGTIILLVIIPIAFVAITVFFILDSAKCPSGTVESFNLSRDLISLIVRDYSLYNKDDVEVLRIDGKLPLNFTMTKKSNIDTGFVKLEFSEKFGGFTILPSYNVYDTNDVLIAEMDFRVILSNKYVIKYYAEEGNTVKYESQKNIYFNSSKTVPKVFAFYNEDGDKLAHIKENQTKYKLTYNICFYKKLKPIVKQLLIASVVALDQHEDKD
jgi:hypothetical protein